MSEARMPGVACDWLSDTAIVLNGRGTPPATAIASTDASASARWLRLHGIVPVHVEATPTIGPSRRAGSTPIARKCERAPAREAPAASSARARRRSASWEVPTSASVRCPPVRLGLLTTASINGAILGARSPDAPFEIVAVGSRDRARAEAYAREHDIPRAHGSYDELLADDAVDAVYIALPAAL